MTEPWEGNITKGMTTLQKSSITVLLTIAVGAGIYEARQAATARNELLALQQQQTATGEQTRQWQHEHGELVARISELKSAPDMTELSRLRGEVTKLRGELKDLPAHRAELLKQKLAQMPDKGIPELQFLTEQEWLNAAWDADLDSDD